MSVWCLKPSLQVLVQEPYGLGNAARAITAPKHWRAIHGQLEDSVQLLDAQPGASLKELCRRRLDPSKTVTADTDLRTTNLDTAGQVLETSDLELETTNLNLAKQNTADLGLADLDLADLNLKDLDQNLAIEDNDMGLADLDLEDLDIADRCLEDLHQNLDLED